LSLVGFLGIAIPNFMLALVMMAAPARADTQPWAVGVTEAQKQKAHQLLEAGNALFLERKYGEALDKYREAIGVWDHPAIRFNIVRCLVFLDKPVEAAENLKLALTYGAAPLEEQVYSEALGYEKLLAKQVGEVVVSCEQDGVALALDGKPLATCPAKEPRRVTTGRHQVVGTKHGFVPRTITGVSIRTVFFVMTTEAIFAGRLRVGFIRLLIDRSTVPIFGLNIPVVFLDYVLVLALLLDCIMRYDAYLRESAIEWGFFEWVKKPFLRGKTVRVGGEEMPLDACTRPDVAEPKDASSGDGAASGQKAA